MHVTKVDRPPSLGLLADGGPSIACDGVPGMRSVEVFEGAEACDHMGSRTVLGTADMYTYGPPGYVMTDVDVDGTNVLSTESVCCGIILRAFMMPIDGAEYTGERRLVTVVVDDLCDLGPCGVYT